MLIKHVSEFQLESALEGFRCFFIKECPILAIIKDIAVVENVIGLAIEVNLVFGPEFDGPIDDLVRVCQGLRLIVLEIERILERGTLGDISDGQLPELELPRFNPDPPFQRVRDDFRLWLGRVKEVLNSQIHLDQQRPILLKVLE